MQTVSTNRVYLQDTYLTELNATVITADKDENGTYFIPNQTIFHPQGGGQPADVGTVSVGEKEYQVTKLIESGREGPIRHYVNDAPDAQVISGEVVLRINLEQRRIFAKLHSGGHILASVTEDLYPELVGYKGNHFPGGQSFVVFKGSPMPTKEELKQNVEGRLKELIAVETPFIVDNASTPRTVTISGLKTYPCGGTHVRHAGEMDTLTIRSVRIQKGELKIGYDVQ